MPYKPLIRDIEDLRGLVFSTPESSDSTAVEMIDRAFFSRTASVEDSS